MPGSITPILIERQLERVTAGDRLSREELHALADSQDILALGMLSDVVRQRARGRDVTYVRVALLDVSDSSADAVPPAAQEVRITGAPETLDAARTAVTRARAAGRDRTVSGFSWADILRLADGSGRMVSDVLGELRDAGLYALAAVPIDRVSNLPEAIDRLVTVGFRQVKLTVEAHAAAEERIGLFMRAAAMQDQFACVQVLNPLPSSLNPLRPTTGYDDVKAVALARLAATNIPTIQVDWLRYGPKLAQVALTFGCDDLDTVPASDEATEGRRRAPLEEVRRNIEAAGFMPVERDGRFSAVAQ